MAQSQLGRNAFTVQEAVNMDTFSEWYYEVLDLSDDADSTYITSARPAKKIVLYATPGAASTLEAADVMSITINGNTGTGQKLLIDLGDLPFTITGVLMTSLNCELTSGEGAGDNVALMSFH